jgi:dipeptidyl aminopeptidase/acylaminoacyl peptidase
MSAGGHLALVLGTTGSDGGKTSDGDLESASSRVAAVAALVPPTDLRVAVWDAPESLPAYRQFPALDLDLEKAAEHSPLLHVTTDDAPALVIMGAADELVPPRHGEWIAEAYDRHEVPHKLIVLPGAGHGLEGKTNRRRVIREVLDWFETHLKEPDQIQK